MSVLGVDSDSAEVHAEIHSQHEHHWQPGPVKPYFVVLFHINLPSIERGHRREQHRILLSLFHRDFAASPNLLL
jgi:hypothetical protein